MKQDIGSSGVLVDLLHPGAPQSDKGLMLARLEERPVELARMCFARPVDFDGHGKCT